VVAETVVLVGTAEHVRTLGMISSWIVVLKSCVPPELNSFKVIVSLTAIVGFKMP
jgi:hypothetical protein